MTGITRRSFCSLIACAALPALGAAEPWPTRPVRILVPGGAGGVTDVRARWIAARLAPILGQPVVVENRAGAGGLIGMEAGARSAPDGYTLVIVHQGTIAVNPFIHARLPYDPFRDFTPITRLGAGPLVFAVPAAGAATSLREFIDTARAARAPLAFGSPGIGTPPHVAGELFKRQAGIGAVHVPYRGGGQAAADLIAGHVDFAIEGLTVMLPHIRAGRVRALATTGTVRTSSLPEVPTMAEAGMPEYAFLGWVGIVAPAATPPAIVEKVHNAIAQVLATEEAREWFGAAGADSAAQSPQDFGAFMRAEHARLGPVIRDAGIKSE